YRLFLFTAPPPTQSSPLSLHDALPISAVAGAAHAADRDALPAGLRRGHGVQRLLGQHAASGARERQRLPGALSALRLDRPADHRSEEHTSELQSRGHLVCRLLLEKKKQ